MTLTHFYIISVNGSYLHVAELEFVVVSASVVELSFVGVVRANILELEVETELGFSSRGISLTDL